MVKKTSKTAVAEYLRILTELKTIGRKKGFKLQSLGRTGPSDGFPILGIHITPRTPGKTICLVAGIHGNERSGPSAIITFLRRYRPLPGSPKLLILPLANPTGFAADTYRDYDKQNLNRLYGPNRLTGVRKILHDAIRREKPWMFVSLHEDDVKQGAYLYGYGRQKDIFFGILDAMSRHCPIFQAKTIYGHPADRGLISDAPFDGSLEARMWRDGTPYSICLEVPDKISTAQRIKTILAVIDKMIEPAPAMRPEDTKRFRGIKVQVNDLMQRGYIYYRTEPMGRNFHPEFKPELNPRQMLELGVFGGRYMTDCRKEFPATWFRRAKLSPKIHDPKLNYFRTNASQPLSVWRQHGWIHPDDPRGWFQWYCRYYMGRRMPKEDERQIKRWTAIRRHIVQIKKNCRPSDLDCHRKQRQALLHWAYDSRRY